MVTLDTELVASHPKQVGVRTDWLACYRIKGGVGAIGCVGARMKRGRPRRVVKISATRKPNGALLPSFTAQS